MEPICGEIIVPYRSSNAAQPNGTKEAAMLRQMFVALACFLFASIAMAAGVDYQSVRGARPDGSTSKVENFVLQRDVYRFEFRSGAFHFLAPADGHVFGAIFLGDGSYNLQPATAAEKRQLRLMTADGNLNSLSDSFDEMVLLFTDGTADEIRNRATSSTSAAADARAVAVYEKYLDWQKKKAAPNLQLRVFEDLLNRPGRTDGVFLARIDGKKYAPALIVVDPSGISNLAARFGDFSGDEVAFLSFDLENPGFWYLCAKSGSAANGRSRPIHSMADAQHYEISTSIEGSKIDGKTIITFRPVDDGIRVLPINILPKLRIRKARQLTSIDPVDLGVVQEEVPSGVAALFKGEGSDADAAIVFPNALDKNATVRIELEYGGDGVLQSYEGGYSVRARESWYPNLGTFTDLATYDMTFRYPKRNNLVAVGALANETVDGGQKVAVWKSTVPIRVAGFNYGRFEKTMRHDIPSGVDVEVFTDPMWSKLANDTLADAMNAARMATALYGRAPYPRVAVAQQIEWGFGQSWPTLVYLPTLALTTQADRAFGLGMDPRGQYSANEFAKMVTWHEVSHQWWGHQVGWGTYRDQWLSEGFAEFTAAMVLQLTESLRSYDKFWEMRRQHILEKRSSIANDQVGPISQGYRLISRAAPGAAQVMIYEKGAYVVHMLRMMMRDTRAKNPDEPFIAMMTDFLNSYAGQNPTTGDFQSVVERHMSAPMDAGRNHRMDWFFNEWVDGTEIPRLVSDVVATESSAGKYRVHGSVRQEAVSEDFVSLVPLYFDFGNDNIARLGLIRVKGSTPSMIDVEVPLSSKPRRMVINALHDVLARD